ncbi:MAG: AAA family ATPase [Treponema sp.]|jgi:SpoVK/Ycf46/Vps4 family AAA+-type ATPase|nr:AAA family ATPase [Treponema sp.]
MERNKELLLSELNSLPGLSSFKKEIEGIVDVFIANEERVRSGVKSDKFLRLVFSGNPGTGKSTAARILGGIYGELGVLSRGHFIEINRSDLVSGYSALTSAKMREAVSKAKGGVLFIDEASSLSENTAEAAYEAIDTLLALMKDNQDDVLFILAGYPDKMKEFLNSNAGLASCFHIIAFDDDNF